MADNSPKNINEPLLDDSPEQFEVIEDIRKQNVQDMSQQDLVKYVEWLEIEKQQLQDQKIIVDKTQRLFEIQSSSNITAAFSIGPRLANLIDILALVLEHEYKGDKQLNLWLIIVCFALTVVEVYGVVQIYKMAKQEINVEDIEIDHKLFVKMRNYLLFYDVFLETVCVILQFTLVYLNLFETWPGFALVILVAIINFYFSMVELRMINHLREFSAIDGKNDKVIDNLHDNLSSLVSHPTKLLDDIDPKCGKVFPYKKQIEQSDLLKKHHQHFGDFNVRTLLKKKLSNGYPIMAVATDSHDKVYGYEEWTSYQYTRYGQWHGEGKRVIVRIGEKNEKIILFEGNLNGYGRRSILDPETMEIKHQHGIFKQWDDKLKQEMPYPVEYPADDF